ncbi:unnamed protein product, partial [Musa hybrid cultivar]
GCLPLCLVFYYVHFHRHLFLSLSLSLCCCCFYLLHCTPLFPVAFEHFLSNHFLHHGLLSHVIPPIDPP